MKPTPTRVKRIVEQFEKEVMNPIQAMINTAQEIDNDEHYYDRIEDRLYWLREHLMDWYKSLAPKEKE